MEAKEAKRTYQACNWDLRYSQAKAAREAVQALRAAGLSPVMFARADGYISVRGQTPLPSVR